MAKYRRGRINDAVAQELAIAIGNVREPKVVDNFVSITRAEVAPDLKFATVYYSCIGDAKEAGEVIDVSCGRRTRAVIITDSDHIILSAIQAETITNRLSGDDEDEIDDADEE